jgi:O-antigen/teichoic acid export membrane protein
MKKTSNLILQHIVWRGLYFFSVLIINILIARFFAAEKSGQFFYLVNNLAFLLLIVSLSLESGTVFYISSGKANVVTMARINLLWAICAAVAALGIWILITKQSLDKSRIFYAEAFLYIFGMLLTTYFSALFYSLKRFALPNKILFAVNLVLIAALLIGKSHSDFRNNFLGIYLSCFFLQGLIVMLMFFNEAEYFNREIFKGQSNLKNILKYSLTALIANIVYFLVNRVDYWFVKKYCSAEDLGNYIQASKLGQLALIIPAILGSSLFTIFSSTDKPGKLSQLLPVARILLYFNLLICLMVVIFGKQLFPYVFGESFQKMYLLFLLLIPGILAFTINNPVTSWFSASNRVSVNVYGGLFALIIIIVGDSFILPRYGIWSAPLICSAGYSAYNLFCIYKLRKEKSVSLKDFFLLKKTDVKLIEQLLQNLRNPSVEVQLLNETKS